MIEPNKFLETDRALENMRELAEMAYLWQVPHRIDGRKLEATIGAIPHTPFETAIMDTLEGFDLLKKRA